MLIRKRVKKKANQLNDGLTYLKRGKRMSIKKAFRLLIGWKIKGKALSTMQDQGGNSLPLVGRNGRIKSRYIESVSSL